MSAYALSELAGYDIEEIVEYLRVQNRRAAESFVDALEAAFKTIAAYPEIGRLRLDIAPTLRSLPVGVYLVFYRRVDDGIEIVRVLHGQCDVERAFSE